MQLLYYLLKNMQMAKMSSVDRIYTDVKNMVSHFDIKPDEKLNEARMAERLGASRTPLREALNRLVSEGFLTFSKGRGFSGRSLNANQILDLYQAREAVEAKMVELASQRASPSELENIRDMLKNSEIRYHEATDAKELVGLDEQFHMAIAGLSQNTELIRILKNLNDRIRFVRTIDLEKRRVVTPQNHLDIIDAMIAGDVTRAVHSMQTHVVRSSEEATEAVRKAYARIYLADPATRGVT
jgi:DNA-binding GntR family transcriptional regulator